MPPIWIILISSLLALAAVLFGVYRYLGYRFLKRLRSHSAYSGKAAAGISKIEFKYAGLEDENLLKLREEYRLDEVAGDGPELEQIIRLMIWVNKLAKHAPNPKYPDELNALNLINLCQTEKIPLNCWMYSMILNEIYLAMGFTSRMVHMRPPQLQPKESHVVVSVFSRQLGKWVMMDPDMCGYMMDENGTLLSIPEIRLRLIEGLPMRPSPKVCGFIKALGKGSYRWYLSKNIFRYMSPKYSRFNYHTERSGKEFIELIPDGYRVELLSNPQVTERGNTFVYINDEELFWQV